MARKRSQADPRFIAKLKSSGLTEAQGEELGFKFLEAEDVKKLHESHKQVPGLFIPYYDVQGRPLSQPRLKQFYRLRYLDIPIGSNGKPAFEKYTQPPGTDPAAYFPKVVDWEPISRDHEIPLIVTEGELKAAKACVEGYPTIGLGGVWSFRSARLGIPLLDELCKFDWARRQVYLAFDSDFRTNQQVCRALMALADELKSRGAFPLISTLPDLAADGSTKTGLDDLLVHGGASALDEVLRTASQPLTLARNLWRLNDKVAYVKDPGLVVVMDSGQKLSPSHFKDHAFSHFTHAEQILKDDGSISLKPTSAAAAWLKWPLRHEVSRLTYRPGQPRLTESCEYNTWPGWGVEPSPGDVSPFLQLVDHLFSGAEPEAKAWFLAWCAYPIQFPGTKLFSSAVLHGRVHGTGKSLLGYTLGRIYGRNFTEIKQSDLHASFNEWAENRQFVLGDDVTGSDRRADADMLKKLITQHELRLNPKYIPSYVVPDCINYLWTTNQPDAFFLEDTDRRFFIHEVSVGVLPEDFYVDFSLWLDSGGASHLFQFLLDYDCGGFNPAGPALRTAAKERMTEDVRSDLGSWVRRLKEDPDRVLRVGDVLLDKDLYSNAQLLELYDPDGRRKVTANGLGRELRRAGVVQVLRGLPVPTPQGQQRLYAVRNPERWVDATMREIMDHLDDKPKPVRVPKYRRLQSSPG